MDAERIALRLHLRLDGHSPPATCSGLDGCFDILAGAQRLGACQPTLSLEHDGRTTSVTVGLKLISLNCHWSSIRLDEVGRVEDPSSSENGDVTASSEDSDMFQATICAFTMLHAVCDGQVRPVVLLLSEGQMSDYKGAALTLDALPPAKQLIAAMTATDIA